MSGDEWRISAKVQFFRNGEMVHEDGGYRNVESLCGFLAFLHARARDDGHGYFAGEGDTCDQEGCSKQATVVYRLKDEWCDGCSQRRRKVKGLGDPIRVFCQEHRRRGDCAFEDADKNYERLPPSSLPEPTSKPGKPA
jgi:hypothetical protein